MIAVLGALPDLYPTKRGYEPYAPSHSGYAKSPADVTTAWLPANEGSPATALELKLESTPPADDYSLVLSIGIRFGTQAP